MTDSDAIWLDMCENDWVQMPLPKTLGHETFVSGDASDRRLSVNYFREKSGDALIAKAVFGPGTQGPPGHAHGGSIAALLDEAMGFAAWAGGHHSVAVDLNVRFRSMLPLGARCLVTCKIVSVDGRKVKTEGAVSDSLGNLVAEGEALFLTLDQSKFGQLAIEALARLKQNGNPT